MRSHSHIIGGSSKPINTVYPIRNAITGLPGLIAYWPSANGTNIIDQSGRNNHLTNIGSIPSAGPKGLIRKFDGIDDYLTQKVYANKVGAVTMATNTGGAMLIDAGLTGNGFRPYAGASGNTPYILLATDTGGKVAWGYLGEEGTGETLGANIYSSFDFTSGWTAIGGASIDDSDTFVVPGPSASGIYNTSLTAGKLYKITVNVGATSCTIWTYDGVNVQLLGNSNTTFYATAKYERLYLRRDSHGTVDVTSISVQEVTDPATTTGVKIYSTKNGTTQSWANVETGFLPNSVASYDVRKSDFQITGALTVGAWVKGTGQNNIAIIDKYSWANNMRSWSVESSTTGDYDKVRVIVSDDGTASADHYKDYISSSTVFDNTWHYYAFTFNNGTLKLYVDGAEDTNVTKSADYAITSLYDTRYPVYLAGIMNSGIGIMGNLFAGSIQSPFIYSRALSASEIADLYNQVLRPI